MHWPLWRSRARDASTAITMAAHVSLGATPFFLFGTRRAEATLPRAAGARQDAVGIRIDRTRCRQRCRQRADARRASRRSLGRSTEPRRSLPTPAPTSRAARRSPPSPDAAPTARAKFRTSSCRRTRLVSRAAASTARWDGAPPIRANCRSSTRKVPEENLLGPRGEGYRQFLTILDGGRISVAALSIGLAMGAYDEALAYAKERHAFGQPISKFQAISFKLVDMLTQIEHAKLMMLRAAWEKDTGRDYVQSASFAKLYRGRTFASRGQRGAADSRRLRFHGRISDLAHVPRSKDQ